MVKMNGVYEGQLSCELTHELSGSVIRTDAPKDNMGIAAAKHQIDLKGTTVDVSKEMITTPVRRIGSISVTLHMAPGIPHDKRAIIEAAAHSCPVHKSLHPDLQTPIQFIYP